MGERSESNDAQTLAVLTGLPAAPARKKNGMVSPDNPCFTGIVPLTPRTNAMSNDIPDTVFPSIRSAQWRRSVTGAFSYLGTPYGLLPGIARPWWWPLLETYQILIVSICSRNSVPAIRPRNSATIRKVSTTG